VTGVAVRKVTLFSNCNYADDGKGLQIDVDKILGIAKDEVSHHKHIDN